MNTEKILKEIAEKFMGTITPSFDGVDFENGYITKEKIEKEYEKYKEIENEINDYIEENDLDDVSDHEKIMNNFNLDDYFWFASDQARLKDFDKLILDIIEHKNLITKSRDAKIMFNKNGNGFTTTRITLPVPFVKELGFTEEDRACIIKLVDNKIIIEKC